MWHCRRAASDERRARLYELTATRDAEDVAVFELSQARGRLFTAESDLIEQVIGLKLAETRLRQSQAALASACGFNPKMCCEGPCNGACIRCQARTCCPGELPCRCEKCCPE